MTSLSRPFAPFDDEKNPPGNDRLVLAPLRGVTGRVFREVFARHFGGLDEAVAPFIPTVHGARVKPRLLADVQPQSADAARKGLRAPPVVPQVLGRDPAALRVMLGALRGLGHDRVNLNAGCPWPMVVKRGRGAGLLADETALAGMLEAGCETLGRGFSVKVRLGLDDTARLLKLMPLLNSFPLGGVAIHARTARQMYEGAVDLDAFARAADACAHPVTYNGDIFTLADFARLKERFPGITQWMVGRGVVRDPLLCGRIKSGVESPPDLARVMAFHDDYFAAVCAELSGARAVLGRMKELWFYLHHSLPRGEKLLRGVQLCATLEEYHKVTQASRPAQT